MDTQISKAAQGFKRYVDKFKLNRSTRERFIAAMNEIMISSTYYDNEIFKIIDEVILDNRGEYSMVRVLPKGTKLFRARQISDDAFTQNNGLSVIHYSKDNRYITTGFNEPNSVEPPLYKPDCGRNNIRGVSYLYVAEDPATACSEIKASDGSYISLAEFEICTDLSLIDFSQDTAFDVKLNAKYEMSLGEFVTDLMSQ